MHTKILLAGQPNCGKSSIFNMLTGARQHVANYPGITVEKKIGFYKKYDEKIEVVDLPGTYSLSSFTQEEIVARESILKSKKSNIKMVLDIADASNLERNLYLTFQLLEMEVPVLLVLNMIDVIESKGYSFNTEILEKELDVPVVKVSAKKETGKENLYENIKNKNAKISSLKLDYGTLEKDIYNLSKIIEEHYEIDYPSRWVAIKVLESDEQILNELEENKKYFPKIIEILKESEKNNSAHPSQIIAQIRYKKAEEIINKSLAGAKEDKESFSHKLDKILCHKFFGPLILIFILYLFFQAVLGSDTLIQPKWQLIIGTIREKIISFLPTESLINDGTIKTLVGFNIVNGAFALLSYIPMFLILFILVGIMEDTGYMARIAFMLDKLLKFFGLHGQSVLPLLLGGVGMGGCAIPGIMATRGMKDERAKLVTRLIVPILNCGAKIPFYLMIAAAFFKENAAFMLMIFYGIMFGIVLIIAKLLDSFVVKGEKSPFILEMPEYHMPNMVMIIKDSITKVKCFLTKIGTVIIPFMAVMWVITSIPGLTSEEELYYSEKYQKVQEKFLKQNGEDNPYTKLFSSEENKIAFIEYSEQLRKKTRKIKEKEKQQLDKIDSEFQKRNKDYFEAMALGNSSNISDALEFESFVKEYKEKSNPIKEESLKSYDILSKSELSNNPEFFKIASKGRFNLSEETINELKNFDKEYKKVLKNKNVDSKNILLKELYVKNPVFFNILKDGKIKIKKDSIDDKNAKETERNFFKIIDSESKEIKKERKEAVVADSIGGKFGKFLEPFTKFAGFDWRVNLAFISTFAAKENFVAVINGIFGISINESGELIGAPWTTLNGICLMIALALFPPCIPTLVLVKTETKELKWMLFVTIYPIFVGYFISIIVYQAGSLLGIG
jgi:ferrous iron transport protein B